ncbi:cell wall-binding repeat-containing protein [Lagierella massiliensis]|uniref:cell wall-binding repeat-containing protein n=1 Tax=Lagierella massiliensis TaxID=1689303 RepID=UPI0006D8153D|nr:cell wall-binding repeat-containing protein [Lagierella massiliensis]
MKKFVKQGLSGLLAIVMLLTGMPLKSFAAASVNHDDLINQKSRYVNEMKVNPVTLEEGKKAADYIKNPAMPKLFTMRADFKVPRNDEEIVGYQPYIATVGDKDYTYKDINGVDGNKVLTDEEKSKIDKKINLPGIDGYTAPTPSFNVNYDYIKNNAEKGNLDGDEYKGEHPYLYIPKQGTIKIKHTFQKLENRDVYDKKDGEENYIYTYQTGVTGTAVTIKALDGEQISGYVPEVNVLTTQVPQNSAEFEIEMRYNRAIFDVKFNSDGGTDLPGMTLIYGQTIPKLNFDIEKAGSTLQGWKVSKDITYTDQAGNKQTLTKDTLIKKEDFEKGGKFQDGIKYAMPAESLTFTAEWKDEPKADYVIQFWTEKPDYDDKDDTLLLRERYDFIGSRRVDNADTGSKPDLTNLDIHGITFPDLNDGRLEKAQDSKEEFERYFFLNEDLTKKQNASKDNPDVQKSVLSTGETVYNVYYDRRVYTLYFTAANEAGWDPSSSYWPTLTRNGQVIGKKGSPYKVEARFNQSLDKIWPRDEEISGLPPASSAEGVDMGPIGWTINVNEIGELIFRDTPPYRLSAEDFIDSQDVVGTGDFEGHGHGDKIPIGENETKDRGKYEISLAATSWAESVVHHIDIIKDDFDGKEQIDYDLSYWKSDTNTFYAFILPNLQGFTLKKETREAEWVLEKPTTNLYRTIDELNNARNEKTPFRSDADKIEYIDKFPWGTKYFDGKNAYNYANYSRNSYKLKLNNDPKTVKNDNEYGAGNILDVPYEKPLKDLKLDTTNVPNKPDWVPEKWGFKGWALDPAGENLIQDGNETKLHYDQVLYAKWAEPDTIWKVKFDPNGGSLVDLSEKNITNETEELEVDGVTHTYPEKIDGEENTFNFVHNMTIKEPQDKFKNIIEPKRDGYNFAGWEIVRYTKDEKGNDTTTVDTSYKDLYKVPEMYHFGNEVVGNVHLRAIWNKKDLIIVEAIHHFLDVNYKEKSKEVQNLYNRRVGSYTTGLASRQGDKYLLVPQAEWEALEDANPDYKKYKEETKRENSYNQILRVNPLKIYNPQTGQSIYNPDAKNNRFEFFYRPFKERVYEVNYLDDRGREEVEAFMEKAKASYQKLKDDNSMSPEDKSKAYKDLIAKNKTDFKAIKDKYSIISNEKVVNGKRHYDARNFRVIPGWVLNDKPQQQLFFDLYEDTDTFAGINETGMDEINFFYKDVRVIEVKDPEDPVPEGYVRIKFVAENGGSFTDSKNNPVKELYYDVIVGLNSNNLPVPEEVKEGETKVEGNYNIAPDAGKKFTKWDNEKLLNKDTIINKSYVFTAYFDWSGVKVNEIVKTEAYKDNNGNWTNDFAPTIDELKKQVKWVNKDGKESDLPNDAVITLLDEAGNEITQDGIYEKVKELNRDDSTELVRTVKFPAKIKFADNSVQEIEIPVKIYKNVYEALTSGEMPKVLKDATSADGDLAYVTGKYVKVTVNPTGKPGEKDSKIYYVNPNAWVEIPEIELTEEEKKDLGFTHWSADKDNQNENGIYDFTKRHKFTEDTVIKPGFTKDVVPQEGEDKPPVPDNFVKVTVKTTDKAKTEYTKTFWVNPTKEVTIPVTNPVGKTLDKTDTQEAMAYTFKEWKSDKENLGPWTESITAKFTEETVITAEYDDVKNIIPYNPEEPVERPDGYVRVSFVAEEGLTLSNVKYYYVKANAGVKLGSTELDKPDVEAKTGYEFTNWDKDDELEITDSDIVVKALSKILSDTIEKNDDTEKPKNYVEVKFVAGENGSLKDGETKIEEKTYFVNPNKYVKLIPPTVVGDTGYEFGAWDKDATIPTVYEKDVTTITAQFNQIDAVSKEEKPGYVKVTFEIEGEGGKIVDGETSAYYVDPNRKVTIESPKTKAKIGYKFEKWNPDTATPSQYTEKETVIKGTFTKLDNVIPGDQEKPEGYLTIIFDKGIHGKSITGQTVFYIKPGTSFGEIKNRPIAKSEIGYWFKGWGVSEKKIWRQFGETIYGQHRKLEDVIPKTKDDESEKPEGYIAVTFSTEKDGKIKGTDKTEKVVYVNPTIGVSLKGFDPEVTPNTGFDFATWDIQIEKKIQYSDGDVIKALYNEKDNVIPQEKTDGSDKPAGYLTVTFDKGEHGKLSGKTVYYVKPGVEVTVPAPTVTPETGWKQKAGAEAWDSSLTNTFKENAKITAQYAPLANIIPGDQAKPEGYVTVTFVADDNGSLSGTTKYYVNPNGEVDLTEQANGIAKNPNTGFTAEGGTWDKELNQKFAENTEIKFNFKALPDVIDSEGNDQPKGYVKVEFTADENGKLKGGDKTYYVNRLKEIKIGSKELPIPEPEANENYTFDKWLEEIDKAEVIKTDKKYVATFKLNKVTMAYEAKDKTEGTVPEALSYDIGTEITLAGGNDLKKDNYELIGWKIGEKVYKPGEKYTITENTKAIAVWQAGLHTVQFDTKGATFIPSQKVEHDKTIGEVIAPQKDGYTFIGWTLDGNPFDPKVDKVTKDITLVAQYVKDIVPQEGEDKPNVPDNYVKITFVIDGEGGKIVDGDTTVYYVNPEKEVTIPQPKTVSETGYQFDKWNPDTKTANKYTGDTTVKGSFTKLDDIIPSTDDQGNENPKPEGYVTVTFVKGEHGEIIKGQTVYYVNPEANPTKTLADIEKPKVKADTGYKFKNWDFVDTKEIISDIKVTAQYDSIEDVIPKTKDDESEKPEGYITVTFVKGEHGKELKGQSIYYVNPNKAVVLKDKAPKAIPNKGYEFARWDVSIDQAIQYEDGAEITALYNDPGNISTTEVDGYVKVEFNEGKHGTLEGTTEYWIKPGVEVNVPAPTVKANVGYKFDKWDKKLTVNLKVDDPTYVITAGYTSLDDIIPQKNTDGSDKPEGYFTVTFKAVNGSFSGTTVYYVKPNVEIDLTDTADAITKTPNVGFIAEGGTWDPAIVSKEYTKNAEYTFTFKALPDVIEKIDEGTKKPDGYVTVTLIPTNKAKDATNKVYFVNPTKEITISNKPEGKKETISGIEYNYTFNGWTVTRGTIASWSDENIKGTFTQDTEITAKYSTNVKPGELIPAPVPKKDVVTAKGDIPKPEDLIENIPGIGNNPLPENTTFKYTENGTPNVDNPGETTAKIEVKYPNGDIVIIDVPVTVVDNVVPQNGKDKPNVPDNYVTVTFAIDGKGGKIVEGETITYFVNPEKEVTINQPKTVADTGYEFDNWDVDTSTAKKYDSDTKVKGKFNKLEDIIPGTNDDGTLKEKPEGYVTVRFLVDKNGRLDGETIYYVNPEARKTIKEIKAPNIMANAGYVIGTPNWKPDLDSDDSVINKDRYYIANLETEVIIPTEFEINYISGNPEGGTVDPKSETVKIDGGEIGGSTATATKGYKFIKWIDAEGNEVSKDEKIVPEKSESATYIAVFEKADTVIIVPSKPEEPTKPEGDRINGKDRVDTAIEISKKYFGQSSTVIVVDRKDFPDAMTASVLSKLLKAPILLTETNKLDPRVAAEIERLGARDVIIVGGNSSVSEAVKKELAKFDKDTVERIYGKDRYETSAQVARRVVGITGKLGHAVVASGEVFADALTVAPYASREGYPILLVKENTLSKNLKIEMCMTKLAINKVTIAGGYTTVNKSLETSLPTVVERLRGKSRYETAIDIANKKFSSAKEIFLANGEEWMDALVIGPVGGILDMPILLTEANSAPKSLRDYIAKAKIEKITGIGGRSMVSDRVLSELSK